MDNTYTSRLINIAGLVKTKVKSLVAFFVLFLLLGTSTYAQQNRTVSPAGNKGSISINAGQDGKGLLTKVDSYDNGIDDMLKKYDKQIYFTQNKGQWPSHIRYKADFKFGQAIVTDKGMMVGAFDPTSLLASYAQGNRAEKAQHDGLPFNETPVKIKGHGWVMNFAGASPSMRITNKNEHPDKFNYFYGNGFSGTDVSSYDEIWYNNVYNNIDVRYYPSAEGTLEYDVIVKPGANPSAIAINFDGIDKLELTREGHLVLNTSVGAMDLPEPYAYQMVNGKEVKVDAAYALNDKNQLTFTLGSYDTSKPLIIDPIALRWATWVNSNSTGDNHGHGIWVDPSGNIYMVARVDGSTNLITSGAFDTSANGGVDIIVGKYTEPATVGGAGVRVWQTYIGGSNSDNPYVTEMGPDGNLYMAGQTGSTDFPVTGGSGFTGTPINHQSQTGDDIFVLKINPAGNSIKSAVIGGNGTDNAFDLRIATNGDVIVGGFTTSTNLLTQYSGSGAVNSNAGGNDALLFRINQNLDAVSWVRNFGGSGNDQVNILVNNPTTGDIFIAGNTASTSGITAGTPRQGTLVGSTTGFLRRYNSSGTVQWGSYFNSASGGSSSILCMEFNTTRDRLYFAGITTGLGTNNTPSGTYDNSVNGTNDFYIAHMNIDQTFYASTYIGSSGAENNLMGLNVDNNNDVYLFGYVGNDGYPTAGNPLQSTRAGSTDKVFSKINSVLSTLQYSTYYGGANQEEDPVGQRGIKFSNCRIYTIVTAESNDIPLTNGAVTTTKSSSATDIFEPGIVEWANPPDLNNNTIGPNQNICVGGTPALLDGQTPNYVLPTIIRNGTTSAHPALTSGISYQWQSSPDNTTWTNIVGATGEDLTPAQMGALTQTTYYRRVFNGDACVVSPQSNVKVGVFTISAAVVNNTCFGGTAGTITLTPTDGTAGYQYSLNGGAFQSGNVFSGLAAGTYTVNAKDAQNCTATVTVTITQGSEITGNITTTNASCQAVCNGTATVSGVTGGTGPYTYTWLSGGTGATKTGLCAGTNYVVITDAAGCKDTIDFSINTNPPTQISITVNNVYCAGDNSGSATVNILSGTGPFTYLWSNGQTTQTATGLTVGTYTVTVTDANGCSVSSNVIVQEYSNLVALVNTTEANGGNNGTASVSVYGGTSPYTYLWSNGATTSSISGLATGNYSVIVTDASGNTVTQVFTITTINDIAVGSFIINMGVTPQTFANGLKPYGLIYDLTRNQNVPVKWVIKTSKAKDAADFTINGTDFKSGAFVIEAKYRTPAVNAVISNWVSQGVVGITTTAAVTLPVYKTITTFSNVVVDQQNEGLVLPYFANAGLPTSMYTVGLPSNLDGCDDAYIMPHADPTWATHSNLLTFNTTNKGYIWGGCHAPSVLEGIFNPSNSSQRMNFLSSTGLQCYNGNGCGSLITESHGNPTTPYTYQSAYNSDPIMQFMGDLTPSTENGSERWYIPLTTGQWRTSTAPAITTADGASPRQGVKLAYGPGFGNTNNGMVMYEAGHTSDGKGTVANQVAFQRAFFNFLLNAGIQKGLNITANIPQTFVSGVGQTASVTVTGGTAPYTYVWSTACGATISSPSASSTTITFPTLAPQTQCFVTCVVTDACGRRNFVSVAIASQTMPPAPFVITLTGQTNNSCFGACTGAINITPSGATPPYTYTWSNGATTQDLTGLCNGTYTVTVRDANNCTKTATYTITSPTTISATIGSQTNVLCFGQSTGSVTVNATGGTSPYQYKLGSGSYGSSNTFSGLAAGTYVVTVKDANNCTTTVNVTITQPSSAVSVSISSTTNASCGGSNGALTAVGAGGTTPYQYSLNGGTYQSSGTFSGLTGGSYTITVLDGNNCTATVNATINNNAGPTATIGSQVNVLCFGGATGSVTVSQSGGTSPYQYQLGSGSFQTNATFGGLLAGTYTFTVRDANNCVSSVTTTITQPASAVSGSITSQTNVACNGGNGSVTVAGAGGVAPYQYSFNGGAYQSSGTFSNLAAGSYTVTVRDANLCTASVPVTITQPSNLSVSLVGSPTNVLCFGNSTGAFTVAGAGGTAPYQYSNNGGTFQSSGSFTGLAAGSYVVTVKDNNNCTSTVTVTISQPSNPLSGSITDQTNVLCFGNSTGSVTVAASGGTAAYQYKIGSGSLQSSGAFGGLAAGNYVVTIQDANGCQATVNVTINQPAGPLLASSSNQVNVLCFGQSTGSVQINGAGGTSPYEFRIGSNAYGTSNAFTGLAAGTYTFTVRDASGCTATTSVTITQPGSAVDAVLGPQTNVLCFGNTTGSATAVGNGGVSPYTFNINGGAYQASATFNGLGAGTYTLGVKDANGCTDVVTVTITQPAAALNASANVTNASCAGSTNGSVIITATGGTAPYQYQLGSGSFQSGNSFAGLSAGSYTVTVRDNNNCTFVVNFNVSELSSTVSGSITSQTNVLCFGASTGAVTVAGSGGVTPYQYSINGGTFQGSGSFTGLAAGNYFVTVKDANGCLGTVNVTITQPSTPVAGSIVSQTNVLCFGQSTGSVTVSGSGGVGPYQFNINGGSFSASNTFSNLAAGSYTVLVRDANGCLFTLPVTITQPGSPVSGSIVNQTNASCLGAAGSVTVAGSGGTAPYQYSLNGGTFQSSGAFTGLTAGNYTVTVRDANGCTFNVPVNITQPADAVTGSITAQTNVSCFGGNNGAVTVTGAGGVAPYTYSFEGGAFSSTNSFTGLTAGSYDVTVKDNNGCLFVVNVNITQPSAPLSVSITSQTNVSCFGGSNGSVTVIGAGGTPAYVYRIGLGAYQSSGTFNNLAAGTYTITVRDSKLCTSTVTVVITQPSTPVTGTSDDVVPVACYGDASGSFVVIGAGGVAPYTYSFNGGAFNSSNSYVGLVAGTYSVIVRDANGCTSPAVVVTITQPNGALSANIGNQTNILCYGAATGSFSINANGGTAPYQYSLNGGAYNASNTFANLTAGIYLVVVRDANGCTSSPVVVTLTQPNAPLSGSITNSTNVLCFGAATGSATVVAVGGVQPYSYSWNTVPAQTGNTATGLTAGTYTVTVTDFNGCSIQRTVTISQPATPISAAISNITNVSCFGGNNGSATVTASGGTGALSYTWNTNPVQHTATATGLTAGNYIVTITDGNGCTTTRSVTITQPASAVTAALVSQTNVSCFGDNNGSATITASGGTSPLTITWNTVPQQTGFTASNLTPGTYIATATDANGCNATVAVTITGPSQPLSSSIISSTNVTCFGYNNGVAVVSATGGTMPYSYSWSSTPVQTTQVASGLAPGTYIVVITDANNCITTSSVTITGPAAPVAVSIINSVNVACRNEASGSATASASGGTGSLSYTWNTVPAQTGPTATGLVAGTYVVTVVDAFGCSANTSVTITQPATVLTASLLNSGNPTCFGATNGFATVGAQGGNGPYSIVWNTVPQQVGPSATNLGAGNYVAAVTDANGCTRFVNVTLTQPLAAMSGSIINSQNVLCYGDSTGSATVSVSGGTTPYSYSWNSIPSQTGSTATGLPAGTYVVTVTDAQGCSIQRSVTITQPATPISVALVNQHNVTCYGFANGSATVTASGGTGALSYVWNTVPQQVGTSATNLVAGTYVVTVTDVFGCFKTLTVTITQPAAPLSAVINDRTNVLCFGQSTGAATVTVSGGTAPYSFSWNTNPAQTTQTASNLPAGNYIVTVTDANGCVTTASTTISQPATAVNASITNSTNVLCYGNATGSATVSAIGGTPGYTYLWNTVPAQTGPTATGLVAGTYNVTVTDANGCFVVRSVTITQPNAPLSASITNSVNVCPTFATGSATVTASGGTPNYLYSWNTVPAQNSATATGLAAGTYTVTVTDANGCTTTATATISNNPKPQAGGDQSICQKVSAVVPAGQGEIWSSALGNPAPAVINQAGAISGMNTGGIYLFILTNQFGCADTVAVTTTANCPLIANPDNAVTNEDTPVNINVPGNDVDPDGNINNGSVTIVDQPDNGTVTINPVTGVITYTPNANYNGPDSFIYNICDTGMPVYCDTALVTINVVPVNDPPVANEDPGTTPEDTPITIYVPGNDTDPEDGLDSTSVTIVDPPNHGTVVVDTTTGNITYTPDPNYNGPDTLIYSICDQGMPVLCDTALVIINVTPVNDPPVANQDVTSTPEDVPVAINVPVNDTDVDGNLDVTTVTIVDQPNNGTATVDPVTGIITYTPNNNFNGVDTLIYNICDTGMPVYCDTALVVIFVGPVNDPPVANIDHATTPEDVPVSILVPGNDTDNDGNLDPTSVTIVDQPNNGTVTIDPVTGEIEYTPNPNFNGVDTLIYQICDSGIPPLCDTALVVINVTPVNDPPVANIDHASTNEDTQVAINVPGNDTDVDGNLDNGSVVITDQPNNGTATVDPVTGVITYTPNSNFNGVDTLIYNICDTGMPVYCDTALVIINVIPVNDPPIANPDPTTTPEDTPVTINVPDNDTDNDDGIDSTTVTIVYPPNNGTVVVDTATGNIIYTPDPNFNGVDTLIYNICDLDVPAMCDTAIVIITVTPVNDPPIANLDNASTGEDMPVTIQVPGNDTDVDGNLDPTTVTIVDQPNNGTVTVDPVTGAVTYTPNANFNGVDSLIYQICDTGMPVLCDTAYVIINVDPSNDPPIANQDNSSTNEDTPVTILVPGNDTDVDGNLDPTTVTIVDQPNNGTVTVDPVTGEITYTPNPNFNGVDTLIYNICDTGMPVMCDTALVIINVNPVNDPPIANQDNATTPEDTNVDINVPANDTDVDGNLDTTSVTIVTPPVNGTVVINPDGSIVYTPNPNFWGADSLIYQICDTGMPVLCDTAWVYINVETNNDELIAILDTASTPEDTPVTIQVPDNDIDVDNNIDYSSVTIILPPANGTVSGIDPVTGFITYTPNLNFNGTDSLIYQICDLGSPVYCDTAWVYINVGPVNDPPVAVTDTASTLEDTPININIDFNDYDVDGNLDTNSVVIVTPPLFGNAIYDPTLGEIIYTPNANFFGTDSLLYNICDSLGLCDTAWVFITIQSVPDLVLDPSIFPSGNNISCFGANDGSIDLTIDLGVPPYTITWTGPNGFSANTEDISGLAPGTYTVVVVDANGSTATGSITLTEPPLLQSSTVVVSYSGGYNVSCGGAVPACDGSVDLSVVGGSAPYSYSWTGPAGFVAVTQDISGICVGTYTVVVTDANGCTTTQTVTLTAPPALEVGGVALEYNGGYNVSCANACDGSIDLVVNGGVAQFAISWTGPNNFSSSSEDISNLCAGTYVVTVVDANNCSTTATVTLLAPQPLTSGAVAAVVAGGFNITCNGACNGSINATIGGGTAPYSYSWVGPNGFVAITEDLSGLCAGTYVLTVTDANGCTSTSTVTLTQPEVLSTTALAATTDGGSNISCNGACDGSINLTVTGGTAPYTINWVGPNGFVSSLEDISALCVGTYVATVTDANGCTSTVTVTLTEPTPLVSTGVLSSYTGGYNISCNGGNNGSIDVTTTGGSGSYTFNWSGPGGFSANTEDIANLYAGTYTLIVSDVNGCDDTLTFIMTEPEPISLVAVNAPSFCGLSNGTIDLTVNGGSGFYNFVWTDGNTGLVIGNTEDLFNITGGLYIVAVTDTNGCTEIDSVIVGDKPPVVITGTTTPTNCNGTCNGAINVTLVGDGPYIINWTGPNNFSSTDEDLVALCAGTYIITVQDGNSCTVVDTFVITAPNAINITVVANNAATCNASNGSIDISVEGGSGTYSYSWTGPNGFTSTSQDLTGLAEGCYVVTVTDASGCTSTQTICVGSVSALVLNTTPVNVSCNGLNNGSACAEVTGSTPPVSFLWSNGDTTQCTDSLAPGTYVVIVTDANGCTGSDTIVITEPDAIIVAADIPVYPNGYNVSGPDAEDGSIDLTVTGGTVPYTYDWNLPAPNDILEDQVSLPADTYVVVITDANGCTITEEYILTEPPLIELPTGFSPDNGDGLNDFYVIHGIDGLIDNKFTVFNRWGQVIFEKEGYQNDWAGTNFQGRLMPDGTYFILFTVNVPNQGNLTFKATVELRHNLGK